VLRIFLCMGSERVIDEYIGNRSRVGVENRGFFRPSLFLTEDFLHAKLTTVSR
jgi:hypothetical protein